jgi:indole-3-glycerol phosphate synthase
MKTILDEIVAYKRVEIAPLRERFADWQPPANKPVRRDFQHAVTQPGKIALIAEFKRRSPSKGDICPGAEPPVIAQTYEAAGASAMSVLTDSQYFGGSLGDLLTARAASKLPVLRKDFILEPCQLAESAGLDGPDAVLLIAAILSERELKDLKELAAAWGQVALVEVHDEADLEKALAGGADVIGINNRNLHTFEVTLETTFRLKKLIPKEIPVVSESGIRTREEVRRLQEAGIAAMLVGETLMSTKDPASKVRELLGE